jgi:DNA-directed RNA polymerase subunit N (RpoN/RPB10)
MSSSVVVHNRPAQIGDGYKRYLKKLDEIELKVKAGVYDYLDEVERKRYRCLRMLKKYRKKLEEKPTDERYIYIVANLKKRAIELDNVTRKKRPMKSLKRNDVFHDTKKTDPKK